MNKKFIITSSLLFIFCLTCVGLAFAEGGNNGLNLNTPWPASPGFNTEIDNTTGFDTFIKYIYEWSISLAILSVFIVVVYSGVKYMTSAGNPNQITQAIGNIKSAAFGLLLLLGSWLVLNTINPELTGLKMPNIGETEGKFEFNFSSMADLPPCDHVSINGKDFSVGEIYVTEDSYAPKTILIKGSTNWALLGLATLGPLGFPVAIGGTILDYLISNPETTLDGPVKKIEFYRKMSSEECKRQVDYLACGEDVGCETRELNLCLDKPAAKEPGSCYIEFWGASSTLGFETEACGSKIGQVANNTKHPGNYLTGGTVDDIRCIQIHASKPLEKIEE